MRVALTVAVSVLIAALAIGWAVRLHESPAATDERAIAEAEEKQPVLNPRESAPTDSTARSISNDETIDVADRARFNEQAREFFAQAPALPLEEARRRAEVLSQELSRIERAGGMSAGETFLLRAGLIRAVEPDEQQQAAQIRALKARYEIDSRQRLAQNATQADPMFELYKVRESEIVAEVMSLQTIPDGLSREEYLRRRLQEAREQLLR